MQIEQLFENDLLAEVVHTVSSLAVAKNFTKVFTITSL
jgi:hypothetical protein